MCFRDGVDLQLALVLRSCGGGRPGPGRPVPCRLHNSFKVAWRRVPRFPLTRLCQIQCGGSASWSRWLYRACLYCSICVFPFSDTFPLLSAFAARLFNLVWFCAVGASMVSGGAIAGIVIGAVALAAVVIVMGEVPCAWSTCSRVAARRRRCLRCLRCPHCRSCSLNLQHCSASHSRAEASRYPSLHLQSSGSAQRSASGSSGRHSWRLGSPPASSNQCPAPRGTDSSQT